MTITPSDIPQLRQKFETGLLEAGDVDAISVDLDFMLTLGIQRRSCRPALGDTLVLGGECVIETLDYMRAGGGVNACIGFSNGRASWSVIDQLTASTLARKRSRRHRLADPRQLERGRLARRR